MNQFIHVSFEQLKGIHPSLKEQISQLYGLMYNANINDISFNSLSRLLEVFPIAVVKKGTSENDYFVVSGFRQFELLSACHAASKLDSSFDIDQLNMFKVILKKKQKKEELLQFALDDIAGGALLFSLGTKVSAQLEIIKSYLKPSILDDYPKYKQKRNV
ncbi:hypothetical protein LMJ53_15820 [Rheinheimera sp. UJ51]|uniref:hypothetical protein n=1 Tax=unclassified Rheinheimera TaxID=115860 RepID=UPI001E5AB923|nr:MULTISPECIES: hypothetical protein [unclassified Rheinheimera]MCC5453187.1 hypothetical protein [Rheinheimera sp. UJ51]MCF4010869.1 hypothetical protein [Rheinheimera sp. UJ63]